MISSEDPQAENTDVIPAENINEPVITKPTEDLSKVKKIEEKTIVKPVTKEVEPTITDYVAPLKNLESSEEEDEAKAEVDEATLEQELRRREVKHQEAQLLYQYQQKLKSETLQSFTDKPDEINTVRVINTSPTTIEIEWDEPCANNSQILGYTIYLDEEILIENHNELFFVFEDLQKKTCYRIMVVANSDLGDGYKPKLPTVI